jgi:Tol biopolymer transport system component
MNADGTEQRQLIPWSFYPSWSPDGRRMVFLQWNAETGTLWIADGDGSNARPLTKLEDYRSHTTNGGEAMP